MTAGSEKTCALTRTALAEGRLLVSVVRECADADNVIHRACPGNHFANNSMYISLALLLWSFQIVERPDTPIDKDGFTDGFAMQAAPFDVKFIPRIEEDRLKEMMSQPVA